MFFIIEKDQLINDQRFINCNRIQTMEHQKILNLLNEASGSRFVRKKKNIVNDQSNTDYDVGKKIIYNTEVVKAKPCDYNYAYVLIRGNITIACNIVARVVFKNCALFTKCITKNNGTTIDNAEDLVWLSQCITY